jgi:hypothetical protein
LPSSPLAATAESVHVFFICCLRSHTYAVGAFKIRTGVLTLPGGWASHGFDWARELVTAWEEVVVSWVSGRGCQSLFSLKW